MYRLIALLALARALAAQPVVVNGYPEYHADGKPFFPYAAAFFYHRIPVDLWAPSMIRLKEMGLNTLDLYVIWNWHEPTEGTLDLEGRTNHRRNLKRVFELAHTLGFKLILRPGPYVFNEWRNGGYPAWLLRKPGFGMKEEAIAQGWFPIPSSVQYLNSENAARMWLDNETHWKYTARWLKAVWDAAKPYSADVLTVQIDDDLAIGMNNRNGPLFWKYVARNQQLFKDAGVTAPLNTNAAFMRDTGSASAPPGADPLWIIGQWYQRGGSPRLERDDVLSLEFAVEALKAQPRFPPWMIEFNTNQYAGPLDTHATILNPPRDTLLAERILIQNGLRGNTIYPPQDTLFPAGWEFPPGNYHYAWESALDIGLKERPERAWVLRREGALIRGMGSLLAATHEQADVGIVYSLTAFEGVTKEESDLFASRLLALHKLCYHARLSSEYVDITYQPVEALSRYKILLLPGIRDIGKMLPAARAKLSAHTAKIVAFSDSELAGLRWAPVPTIGPSKTTAEFDTAALRKLAVRPSAVALTRGSHPMEEFLFTTLQAANDGSYGFVAATNWADGPRRSDIEVNGLRDRVVLPNVFVPGRDSILMPVHIPLAALVGLGAAFAPGEELVYATAEVTAARFANRVLTLDLYSPGPSEIVLKVNSPPLGNCESNGVALRTTYNTAAKLARIEIPAGATAVRIPFPFQPVFQLQAAKTALPGDTLSVRVLLQNPGEQPLRGRIVLRQPAGWPAPDPQPLQVASGAQPLPGIGPGPRFFDFRLSVPAAAVAGSEESVRACIEGSSNVCSEQHAIRVVEPLQWRIEPRAVFPLRDDVQLPSTPPLIVASLPGQARFKLYVTNPMAQEVQASLEFEGESMRFEADPQRLQLPPGKETTVHVTAWPRPSNGEQRTASRLYSMRIVIRSGSHRVEVPVRIAGIRNDETLVYRYDWDRDGFDDVTIENDRVRAILMPTAGGRVFALIDKATGRNATNSVGGLRDAFTVNPPNYSHNGEDLRRSAWRWPELRLHDREAAVSVVKSGVELRYTAADIFPDGATVLKRITLEPGSDVLSVNYEITPVRGDAQQSFRSGFSTSFTGGEFTPSQFQPAGSAESWLAAAYEDSLLGIFWKGDWKMERRPQKNSTLFELISPALAEARTYRFQAGYCITSGGLSSLRNSYLRFHGKD